VIRLPQTLPLLLGAALAACAERPLDGTRPADAAVADLTFAFSAQDLTSFEDAPPWLNPCGDDDPTCATFELGPIYGKEFPLPSDLPADPSVASGGLSLDQDGWLAINRTGGLLDYGFVANATDWSRGTVSKINTFTKREVARYLTVACSPCGGGQNGCCSNDDPARFAARLQNQAQPDHPLVQLTDNRPSRTAVDFNGDLWIENRAPAGQASATKIRNDSTMCVDRNKNGTIDTSHDVNGDGLIQTDCNGDGQPDDLASVKGKPCANGQAQEFFGLDDECLLFTILLGPPTADGRALALGPGAQDFGPSDAWAGTSADATLYRIDGTTGMIKDRAVLPMDCHPDGLVVDSSAISWTSALSAGPLCWFATKTPSDQGRVRDPQTGSVDGRAVSIDRDQNVWVADRGAARAYRYTPDRSAGTAKLGAGFWTRVTSAGMAAGATGNGVGIALDWRSPQAFFAWLALDAGWIVRIPASAIPLPKMMDQDWDASQQPALQLPGFAPIAVGVDRNMNLEVVSRAPSASILVVVDAMGNPQPPDLKSPPMQGSACPAGDRCLLKDNQASEPGSDAYTQFNGFGLRVTTPGKAFYSYLVGGCGGQHETRWVLIRWDADVPLNTVLTVRARSGNTPRPDQTWGQWTPDFELSPADLIQGMPLVPNYNHSAYLQLEFDFDTLQKNVTPRLKYLQVAWECSSGPG
jgi:hypothetical protein